MSNEEKSLVDHFQLIGSITHHIEQCEFHLSEIFQILCESENEAPFEIIGLIVNGNMKIRMVKIAAKNFFKKDSELKSKFNKVIASYENCLNLRNKAVHASAVPQVRPEGRTEYNTIPLWHQTLRYSKDGSLKNGYKLTFRELNDIEVTITILVFEFRKFTKQLYEFSERRKLKKL